MNKQILMFCVTWIFTTFANACNSNQYKSNPTLFDTIFNPVIFVIGFTGTFYPSVRTSLTRNGTFIDVGIDSKLHEQLLEPFPCAVFMSVFTDDEKNMGVDIDQWTQKQCTQWRGTVDVEHKCFILSEGSEYPFYHLHHTSSVKQLEFLIKNRKRHIVTKSSPLYILKKALLTKAPTTQAPVLSGTCEDRRNPKDCTGHCRYFGVGYKCHPIDYCGFTTEASCRSNTKYCEISPHTKEQKCRKRVG